MSVSDSEGPRRHRIPSVGSGTFSLTLLRQGQAAHGHRDSVSPVGDMSPFAVVQLNSEFACKCKIMNKRVVILNPVFIDSSAEAAEIETGGCNSRTLSAGFVTYKPCPKPVPDNSQQLPDLCTQ